MKVFLLALLGSSAFAGVQISDTIQTPFSNVPFTGQITISGPRMTTAAGQTVAQWQQTYQVTNGVFSVTMEPNDTATPAGTTYSARYVPSPSQRGAPWTETWIVPTSSSPLKINQVRVMTMPAPGLVILPQQIGSGGAALGQCLAWNGASWQPVDCVVGNINATALQGFSVASTTPTGGMVLTWNATTSKWEPQAVTAPITIGTTAQYFRGDLSLATFPTTWAWANLTSVPTMPVGTIVGTTDSQSLTNKSLDGVSSTTMGYLDATSSIQTQINGKAASNASTTVNGTGCALGSTCTLLRTWPFSFRGIVQAGVAGFQANLPSANAPTPTNAGGTDPAAVLEWPTGQSVDYAWWLWELPTGYVSNANISYTITSRSTDSTNAAILTPYWGCVSTATVDAPTWTGVSTVNITGAATSRRVVTTGTIAPTCAAGNLVGVKFKVDTSTNSLTGGFDLIAVTFSVQGGM